VPFTTVGEAVTASPVGKNQAFERVGALVGVRVVLPSKVCCASCP
jgi:hypothetical protein